MARQAFPARSATVTTGSPVALSGFGLSTADIADIRELWIFNHATSNRLIYTFGGPASPSGSLGKTEVPGVGLAEQLEADTPVGTASSEHGGVLLPGQSMVIGTRENITRLRMIAQTGNVRVTIQPFGADRG